MRSVVYAVQVAGKICTHLRLCFAESCDDDCQKEVEKHPIAQADQSDEVHGSYWARPAHRREENITKIRGCEHLKHGDARKSDVIKV